MALDPSEAARGFDGRSAPSPVVLEVAEAVGPPLPGPAKRPKRESLLESIESAVVAEGASEEARKEGGRVLREMMSRSPEDVLKRMVDKKVRLVVIPKDKKLTDLPQAESLKGKKTLDGRSWDDVRGAANIIQKDGSIAVFAGEENLVKDGKTNYPKDYLPVHEWAHSVKDYGLDASGDLSDKKVKEVFETVKKSSGPFPDEYASTTPGEFFAEYTSLWFGTWFPVTNKDGTKPGPKDEAWIKKNAPEMHAILTRLYGPARPMVPEASKGAEASPPVAAKEP